MTAQTVFNDLAWLWLIGWLVALSLVDLRQHRLPTSMVSRLAAGLVALHLAVVLIEDRPAPLFWALLGMVGFAGFLYLIHRRAPEGLGGGDVRLAGPLGWQLGWVAGSDIFLAVALTLIVACGGALMLLVLQRSGKRFTGPVAFGPPLAAATLLISAIWN